MVLVIAFLVLTILLFVSPSTDTPRRVNAIVVLGGTPWAARWQRAVSLARDGYAPFLVRSDSQWTSCPKGPDRVTVICFKPEPATTQGEALDVARLAARHHWGRLLVVTSVPQVTRARIRFDRCYHGTVLFNAVSEGGLEQWMYNLAYEWAALGKALVLQRGCGSGPAELTRTVSVTMNNGQRK